MIILNLYEEFNKICNFTIPFGNFSRAFIVTLKSKESERNKERETKYSSLINFFFYSISRKIEISHSREYFESSEESRKEETIVDFIPNSLFIHLQNFFKFTTLKNELFEAR